MKKSTVTAVFCLWFFGLTLAAPANRLEARQAANSPVNSTDPYAGLAASAISDNDLTGIPIDISGLSDQLGSSDLTGSPPGLTDLLGSEDSPSDSLAALSGSSLSADTSGAYGDSGSGSGGMDSLTGHVSDISSVNPLVAAANLEASNVNNGVTQPTLDSLAGMSESLGAGLATLGGFHGSNATVPGTTTRPPTASATPAAAGPTTQNDVVNHAACTNLTVIFARGTSEAGNVGSIAGPPMFTALQTALGRPITKQGVDYPASVVGNADLGASGGPTMAKLATQAATQCPRSKIVLSGYSQGAMVVHNAVSQPGFNVSRVAAAVLFGDPLHSTPVSGVPAAKVREICATGDALCEGTGLSVVITPAHLTYGAHAQEAASFILNATGLRRSG